MTTSIPPFDQPLIHAYYAANQLKRLYRQGWLQHGVPPERCESVAAHTFGVALLALWLIPEHYPHLDLLKAVQMALIHDLGEAFVGDLTPRDGVSSAEKHRREAEAIARLLEGLPNAAPLFALWQEYEASETPEAQLIHQLDRLEMGLQASVYAREGALQTPDTFYTSAADALHDSPLQTLLDSAT
ncbi:MAG: hypothetical protein Fur0018_15290 [Anaerolineales bacterium]